MSIDTTKPIKTITYNGVNIPLSLGIARDINFYDYDGTLLYSYALSDLPLTALPVAPSHSTDEVPLTFQEWTHTLEQVNACTNKLDVGATYIPTDGKTHLIINIAAEGRMTVPLYFSQTIAGGVSIDWGDGSTSQTLSGTGAVNTTHTYANIGRYDIKLTVASGCTLGFGGGSGVFGTTTNYVYYGMLKEAYIGNCVTSLGRMAFNGCDSLVSIVIPDSVTSIGGIAFSYCLSLSAIVLPRGVTSIGYSAFSYDYSLSSVVLPRGVTIIEEQLFYNCNSLMSIVIPGSVTSIKSGAFSNCSALSSIVIQEGVSTIGGVSFVRCYSLVSIVIPDSVTSIGPNAFNACYSLVSIVIPDSVTSIGIA